MGILKTFLSKPVGSLFVCAGDLDRQMWTCWSDGRIVTIGNFGDKTVRLEKLLASIAPYDGPQLADFIEVGRITHARGRAMFGALAAGPAGALVGMALDKRAEESANATGLVCFEVHLQNGKEFIGVAQENVFQFISGLIVNKDT